MADDGSPTSDEPAADAHPRSGLPEPPPSVQPARDPGTLSPKPRVRLGLASATAAGRRPASPIGRGLGLPTRLLALILLCLLPVIAAETYGNITLRRHNETEAARFALWQAQIAGNGITGLVGGTDRMLRIAGLMPAVRTLNPNCGTALAEIHQRLPEYSFLAVLDARGTIVCSSRPTVAGLSVGRHAGWADDLADAASGAADTSLSPDGALVGRYTAIPGIAPFLPIMRPLPADGLAGGHGGDQGGVQAGVAPTIPAAGLHATIAVGLDLRWLSAHLNALWFSNTPLPSKGVIWITDRDGTTLSRYPDSGGWLGRKLPLALLPLIGAPGPDVARLHEAPDAGWLAAFVPVASPPAYLATIVVERGQPTIGGLDAAATRDIVLVAGAALLAIALTVLAGRRFFVRPIDRLLDAAQRWRDGDLGARAGVGEHGSAFAHLGASFNDMASALQLRDTQLRQQADRLEAQVDARTRDLSQINNRLQVEIAEREKTEAALLQAQKLQAIGQLAGGVAHDFNNMLATILGSLELMESRLTAGAAGPDPVQREHLQRLIERATDAVQRGAHLTARLLAFSRRQLLAVRPTDLNRLIADLISLASSTLGRRVRIHTDLAADLWPALADPSQVEAAILNLCLNARDAMPEGGLLTLSTGHETIHAETVNGPAPGDYVRITVGDTGSGMTPDVLTHAFEPFFSTKGLAGSGLGLSQVYGLAHQSNGTVRIASVPGQGTEVALLLPRAATAAELPDRPRDTAPPAPFHDLHVLLIDDDPAVRQVTAEMLHNLGCQVAQASSAEQALILLDGTGRQAGLLLIDYVMPGMNGIDLAREVRRRGLAMPLLLQTGYAEFGDRADIGGAPVDGVLTKPFTIRELRTALQRLRAAFPVADNVVNLHGPVRL